MKQNKLNTQPLLFILNQQEQSPINDELIVILENSKSISDLESHIIHYPPSEHDDFNYSVNMKLANLIYYFKCDPNYNLEDLCSDWNIPEIDSKLIISDIQFKYEMKDSEVLDSSRENMKTQLGYVLEQKKIGLLWRKHLIKFNLITAGKVSELTPLGYYYYYLTK